MKNNFSLKKHISVILFCSLFAFSAVVYAQQPSQSRHRNSVEFFTIESTLCRVLENGDTLRFSAQPLGGISSFDALNPFKILVFSEDFQKIYYLNRRLALLSEKSLSALGFGEVTCVCASKYGGFWVYDRWQQQLSRVDDYGKVVALSEAFPILDLQNVHPYKMQECGDWLYVFDATFGAIIFDLFGAFITSNPQLHPSDL